MRLKVIASDYDNTIAFNGVLDPAVREAIRVARKRGVIFIIVTGRILSELRDVTGGIEFVDGVVAENGGVIALPNGHKIVIGEQPPLSLITKLRDKNIDFKVGRCVVEMDASYAEIALGILRELELPLSLVFNKGRLMILPDHVSKASGLQDLLNILGVSAHNTIGIGDAENDHSLLTVCQYGVSVEWGSEILKEFADHVIMGNELARVAEYIDEVSTRLRIPKGTSRHRKITLESNIGETPFEIGVRGRNILIVGDSKSGKSWLAGLTCEQLILQGYTITLFDPEGDYASLGALPNTLLLKQGALLDLDELSNLLQQRLSLIFNLSGIQHEEKKSFISRVLPLVAECRRVYGFPHRILIDECHYFLDKPETEALLDLEMDSYTLVTHMPSLVAPEILKNSGVVLATKVTREKEVDSLWNSIDMNISRSEINTVLESLKNGQAALLPPTEECKGEIRQFNVVPRLTKHIRHQMKYFDVPVSRERAFEFTDHGNPIGKFSTTLMGLTEGLDQIPLNVVKSHIERGDFSNWIKNTFGDKELAKTIQKVESKFSEIDSINKFSNQVRKEIEKRYG